MPTLPDRQHVLKSQAQLRRLSDRIWLSLTLLVLVIGVGAWLVTRREEHLLAAGFFAAFPLLAFLYNHFVLLNPWRDPLKTHAMLATRRRRQQRPRINTRRLARVNGWLLVLTSPLVWAFTVGVGADESGAAGAMLGLAVGAAWFATGIGGIVWSRTSLRRW